MVGGGWWITGHTNNNNADDDDDDDDDVVVAANGAVDDDHNTNIFGMRANYIKLSCSAGSGQVGHSNSTQTRLNFNCKRGAACGLHDVYVIYV